MRAFVFGDVVKPHFWLNYSVNFAKATRNVKIVALRNNGIFNGSIRALRRASRPELVRATGGITSSRSLVADQMTVFNMQWRTLPRDRAIRYADREYGGFHEIELDPYRRSDRRPPDNRFAGRGDRLAAGSSPRGGLTRGGQWQLGPSGEPTDLARQLGISALLGHRYPGSRT